MTPSTERLLIIRQGIDSVSRVAATLSDWRSELGFTLRDEAATESRCRAIALIAELIEALTDGQPQV
jgi:hypothetical protein